MLLVIQPLFTTTVVAVQQAVVAHQFRRRQRLAVLFQVSRAGAGHLVPGEQRLGDQTLVVGDLRTYRQVEAIPRQVPVLVVEFQLDLHLWVLPGKLQQQTVEEGFAQGHRNRHTHRTDEIILEPGQCLTCPLHLDHQRLGLRQQRRTRRRQAQAAGGAMQQHHRKLRFQLADALGQLPFAAAQLLGRQGKAAGFDQHGKRGEVIHFAHGLFPIENQRLPISALIRAKNHSRLKPHLHIWRKAR